MKLVRAPACALLVVQPQGSIFDWDGLVTAQQESDESKDKQEKGWHVTPIVRPQFIPSQSATSGRNNGERQDMFEVQLGASLLLQFQDADGDVVRVLVDGGQGPDQYSPEPD